MPAAHKFAVTPCADSVALAVMPSIDAAPYQPDHRQHAAAIICQARVYDRGEQQVCDDTVQTLLTIASAYDHATCDHSARMMHLAEGVARRLGSSDAERGIIRLAALLHDIGKIVVPAAIRQKPGPLTAGEWALMRRHPETGRQIVSQAGADLEGIAFIVAAHHERWDGQGYPHELAREAIPWGARILTVADSFDAMTTQRPYRAPISATAAKAELQQCAGSQYDPAIVRAFLAMLAEREK